MNLVLYDGMHKKSNRVRFKENVSKLHQCQTIDYCLTTHLIFKLMQGSIFYQDISFINRKLLFHGYFIKTFLAGNPAGFLLEGLCNNNSKAELYGKTLWKLGVGNEGCLGKELLW